MFKAGQNGWTPPDVITEEMYQDIKKNPEKYPDELIGYVGFSMSFGGKWWGGYRRDKAGQKGDYTNMETQSRRSKSAFLKQIPKLAIVEFYNLNYYDVLIPPKSIIYCDPPYQGATKYKSKFDHDKFWQWCRETSKSHKVFISEYNAPPDFISVWQKEINSSLTKDTGSKKGIEKLFIYGG